MAKEWWKTFFNKEYVELWKARGMFKATKKEIDFLIKHIPIKKSFEILDLCCGHGRHTLELARRGFKIDGLDFSQYELELAKAQAEKENLYINFFQSDARRFKLKRKYDVILNMFTAFGYGSEQEDRQIIRNVYGHLKLKGKFFIDLMNLAWLWRNYKSYKLQKHEGLKIEQFREFDFLTNTQIEKRIVTEGKIKKIYHNRLHVYSLAELTKLLKEEGLEVENYWGTFKGGQLTLDSKRMLVLAKKV